MSTHTCLGAPSFASKPPPAGGASLSFCARTCEASARASVLAAVRLTSSTAGLATRSAASQPSSSRPSAAESAPPSAARTCRPNWLPPPAHAAVVNSRAPRSRARAISLEACVSERPSSAHATAASCAFASADAEPSSTETSALTASAAANSAATGLLKKQVRAHADWRRREPQRTHSQATERDFTSATHTRTRHTSAAVHAPPPPPLPLPLRGVCSCGSARSCASRTRGRSDSARSTRRVPTASTSTCVEAGSRCIQRTPVAALAPAAEQVVVEGPEPARERCTPCKRTRACGGR
mmetsp:Transcript_21029/g.52367  ORF Transcript_21029/g.52367 Transcript_21029/m.52367 type:complete len:296 (-) Transcript_21029:143-1030(-)